MVCFMSLLFILYINDLPIILNLFKPIIFKDGTTLFFFIRLSLNKLKNNMQIGIDKTNVLLYNIRN